MANGIYLPDGTFRSSEEIRRDAVLKGEYPDPEFITNIPQPKDFTYWSDRMKRRQAEMLETDRRINHAEIAFPQTILLNFIGDTHIGARETDYARLEKEIELIANTPNSYVVFIGDITDTFFFNPAQMTELEQIPEQVQYFNSLMDYLKEKKKLLAMVTGNHELWTTKLGMNMYDLHSADVYYMEGIAYLTLHVGEQDYRVTIMHKPRGHSIYNATHPELRAGKDSQGTDLVVGGDTHSKGIQQQPVKEFGGKSKLVTYASIGAYKSSDEFSRKNGFAQNTEDAMFGVAVRLSSSEKLVYPYYSIIEGNRDLPTYLEQ